MSHPHTMVFFFLRDHMMHACICLRPTSLFSSFLSLFLLAATMVHPTKKHQQVSRKVQGTTTYFFCQVFFCSMFNFCSTTSVILWLSLHTVSFGATTLIYPLNTATGAEMEKRLRKENDFPSHFLCLFYGTIFSSEKMFLAQQLSEGDFIWNQHLYSCFC